VKKALFLALAGWLSLGGTAVRADLHFEQPSADAGEVRSGRALVYRFPFTNRGPEVVEITSLRASCGCMTPRLDRRVYQPGEQGELPLEINTLSQAPGPQAWQVQVGYQTGGATQETTLELKACIRAELTVRPAAMTIFADTKVAHEILLTDLRPRPLAVTAVRPSSPGLKTQLAESTCDADGHRVQKIAFEVADEVPEGRHDEAIGIYTDDPDYPELKVRVTLIKRSRQRVTALPNQVAIVAPAGQPVPSRLLLLRDRDDQPVEVEHVTSDDPTVTCTWSHGPSPTATVRVRVDGGLVRAGTLNTTIQVELCKPVRETIAIPVSCTVNR
jgi:hypothetical protein